MDTPRSPLGPLAGELHGLHILVVDDDAPAREVLRAVLTDAGAIVFAASSAAAAFEAITQQCPDVALVDLSMPVVNGFTFVEQLRLQPAEAAGGVPVAALTGYMSAEDRRRATRAGFQSYLVKPVDVDQLIAAVRLLTGR